MNKNHDHKKTLVAVDSLVDTIVQPTTPSNKEFPLISVVLTTYNHEKYIIQCIEGILAQKGNFTVELIVRDDCSTDSTLGIIKQFLDHPVNRVKVKYLPSEKNLGVTKNLERCLKACKGIYIAICEGDDYWVDNLKLQKQLEFLRTHPDCSFCFHDYLFYFEGHDKYSEFDLQNIFSKDIYSTKELVDSNFIGNFSCCFYDAKYINNLSPDIFNMFTVDWMFNIAYSQFGDIGHITEKMSVYRKHDKGVWTGKSILDRNEELYELINKYNQFTNFDYDESFSQNQQILIETSPTASFNWSFDIVILDDIFPHPLSAFRYQEFLSYLKVFENISIFASGDSLHVLGNHTLDDLITRFKKTHPKLATKVRRFRKGSEFNTKLAYFVFLNNALLFLDSIENAHVPFIFTLYPGGGFAINNNRSDQLLQKVTSSPCFRKVIVTQQLTYDYLIKKKYCRPEQIELIFGVVTPIDQYKSDYKGKTHFGFDKKNLDICFVAHKYTPKGVDKGYDIFIEVAHQLCKTFDNIQFHIVGNYSEYDIDITDIKGHIFFYGSQELSWFDQFYLDKDIILSPNIPNKIYEGSFDGFPTGSCIDAGLRKTAIFCTDPLLLNNDKFVNGKEIVIIPHNSSEIVETIKNYYNNPHVLCSIGENGCARITELYGYESQIIPRMKILQQEIDRAEENKIEIASIMESRNRRPQFILYKIADYTLVFPLRYLKNKIPKAVKEWVKERIISIRFNNKIYPKLKTITPFWLRKIIRKIIGLNIPGF